MRVEATFSLYFGTSRLRTYVVMHPETGLTGISSIISRKVGGIRTKYEYVSIGTDPGKKFIAPKNAKNRINTKNKPNANFVRKLANQLNKTELTVVLSLFVHKR